MPIGQWNWQAGEKPQYVSNDTTIETVNRNIKSKQKANQTAKNRNRRRGGNSMTAELQDQLWKIGAYKGMKDRQGKDLSYEKAVDGINGNQTKQAIEWAKKNGYDVNTTNGLVTKINQQQNNSNNVSQKKSTPQSKESFWSNIIKIVGNSDANPAAGHTTPYGFGTLSEEKSLRGLVANSSPAARLATAGFHGLLGYDPQYNERDIPQQYLNVLNDQSQYIYDNFEKQQNQNIQHLYSRMNGASPEQKKQYEREIEGIKNSLKEVKAAGGLENWLKAHPGQHMRVSGNFKDYKLNNRHRWDKSAPVPYADFNKTTNNYVTYAQNTPLGGVEGIFGENQQYYQYNPKTGQIETFMTDIYDFNPHGSAGEGSEIKQLRHAVGESEILKGTNGKYNVKLSPVSSNRYIQDKKGFTGEGAIEDDNLFQKTLLDLGIHFFKNN